MLFRIFFKKSIFSITFQKLLSPWDIVSSLLYIYWFILRVTVIYIYWWRRHCSTLDWRILWMEEPYRLQSIGLLGVGNDWATSFSLFTFMHWRRQWQPTPVLLPGESQGWGSLVGCRLWDHTESDTTEVT